MFGKKCSLCGGKLRGSVCMECGLDNSKNDDSYKTTESHSPFESMTHVHEENKPFAGKTMTKEQKDELKKRIKERKTVKGGAAVSGNYQYADTYATPKKKKSGGLGKILWIVILIPVISACIGLVSSLIYLGDYEESSSYYEYDSGRYDYVEYDLEETYTSHEVMLGPGTYIGGVHIPEGTYEVTVLSGAGWLGMSSGQHGIYINDYHYVTDGEIAVADSDFRVYDGAVIRIEGIVEFSFSTMNAVYPMEGMANPNTESKVLESGKYLVGEDIVPGVYDLSWVEDAGEFSYTVYVDGAVWTSYELGLEDEGGSAYGYPTKYQNVSLPEGTVIEISNVTVELVPSEVIESEDYFKIYE